jgi:lipopolysaccharide-induced tumor necrosis factor-alpha factor
MVCQWCGKPVGENDEVCPSCGSRAKPIQPAAAPPAGGAPPSQQGALPGGPLPGAAPAVAPTPGLPPATYVGVCPYCRHQGPRLIQKQLSQSGWILFVVLLLLCLPLCWLPFVIDGCKDKIAKCAACGLKVA